MAIFRGIRTAGGIGLLLSLATGCGGSSPTAPPAQPVVPVAAPAVSLDKLVAAPVSPANGDAVAYSSGSVTLVAGVPAPPAGALIVDTFEFDDNTDFSSPTTRAVARESTSSSLVVNLSQIHIEKTIYWRVRSSAGELQGPYSAVFGFRVPAETIRAPVLLEPVNGAIVSSSPRLTLSKVIHANEHLRTWSYDFEIARDEAFSSIVEISRVGEPNISVVGFRPSAELAPGRYFWRGRTFDDAGNFSEHAPSRTFEVRDAFVASPTLRSPAAGASVPQWPTFELTNGEVFGTSGDVPRYDVEISPSASFATVAAQGSAWASTSGTTTVTVQSNLPGGAYYWRARGVKLKTNLLPEMASAWTEPRAVSLLGLMLGAPQVLAPFHNSTTTLRPTLTVANASRTGGSSGAVTYRFELSTDPQFILPPVAVVSVPEGAGSTSWTLPFDAPVGTTLYWRVRASDGPTGAVSPLSTPAQFVSVDSRTFLYTLTLGFPATCGFVQTSAAIYVQTTDQPGSASLRLVANDASPFTVDTQTLTLNIGAGGAVTGTIVGSGTSNGRRYSVAASAGNAPPAAVTGTAAGDHWSGSITGWANESLAPVSSKSCSSTFGWSLTRRQ